MPHANGNNAEPEDRDAVVAAVQAWIEAELPVALQRSDWLEIEIHIRDGKVRPDLKIKYAQIE